MSPIRSNVKRLAVVLAGLTLVGTSCIFGDDGDDGGGVRVGPDAIESGLPDDPEPTRGGKVVYGLEAESDGYCLPSAQLAISGMQVMRAFYDPLVVPNASGGYSPYLAKSIEPNDDHTVWTIALRKGITFNDTDRSPLDAAIVRDNLLAFKESALFGVVFEPVEKVEVVNELTVRVTLDRSWVTFPAALYGGGRVAIVGRSQLEGQGRRGDRAAEEGELDDCGRELVGTGPFRFVSWTPGESIQGIRNEKYWQQAPDGKPYPYLQAVEFRPLPNSDERVVSLQQGEINMLHTSSISDMNGALAQLRDDGRINLLVSEERAETNYLIFNVGNMLSPKPANPILKRPEVRRALAQALDRDKLNELTNNGYATPASGPFAPGTIGYLEDAGIPAYDPEAAKKVVAALKKEGESVTLRYLTSGGPSAVSTAHHQREMFEAVGFDIEVTIADEADLIDLVIGGDFDISAFRNQPSEDPDTNYHWWYGGTVLNFGGFQDDKIDAALDKGRELVDVDARRKVYEGMNRRFAEQQYNLYLWYAPWAVAEASNVHGILGPTLPDGAEPGRQLVSGHPLIGVWIDAA